MSERKRAFVHIETKEVCAYYDYCMTMKVHSLYLRYQHKYEEAIFGYAKYAYYMCNVRPYS